jgi:hypothetical protein
MRTELQRFFCCVKEALHSTALLFEVKMQGGSLSQIVSQKIKHIVRLFGPEGNTALTDASHGVNYKYGG